MLRDVKDTTISTLATEVWFLLLIQTHDKSNTNTTNLVSKSCTGYRETHSLEGIGSKTSRDSGLS